jgi:hypothetical protein
MDKLFVNGATNKHLTFVQRIETLFSKNDSIFIMQICMNEIVNIFGRSITLDSFFSDDWAKRASAEQLKTWFDTKTAKPAAMSSITSKRTRESQFSPQKILRTKSAGGKSRRKKRGSTSAKNHGAPKKNRSSRR